MGKEYQHIDDALKRWIARQHLFFVSTAPRADDGLINCSPKGLDALRVTGPRELVYADVGGSGIETAAHVKENGRIVIMLCAFEGPPKIYRFYGRGRVIEPHQSSFQSLAKTFSHLHTLRNFVVIEVTCIRDACGFGVPQFTYEGERRSHEKWAASKTPEELERYRQQNNHSSLDGLPGLASAATDGPDDGES